MTQVLNSESAVAILSKMATESFNLEISSLLKSRHPLIYLSSKEERRMLKYFNYLAIGNAYNIHVWDCTKGLYSIFNIDNASAPESEVIDQVSLTDLTDIDQVLDKIYEESSNKNNILNLKKNNINGTIYLLLDFNRFLEDTPPDTERRIKNIANLESMTTVIMTGPYYVNNKNIENLVSVVDFPLPNKGELDSVLKTMASKAYDKYPEIKKTVKKDNELLIKSVSGLSLLDAQNAFAKSLVIHKDFNIKTILNEKKQIIKKSGLLEYNDQQYDISRIGGLYSLKNWLTKRKTAFTEDAQKFGIQQPKGIMILGFPGTGKSLTAKIISSIYNIPLLRLDMGALFGGIVGESERNIREALALAESIAPAVLFIDEIDKGISGANSSGDTDGGTTSRVIQSLLTWMQDREKAVFIVCTANGYKTIPPEFMRAGRFDEIFFVDLPKIDERVEIYNTILKTINRDPDNFDLNKLATQSDGYTGAEIEKSINDALVNVYQEHNGKKDLDTNFIMKAIKSFEPLSKMRADEFEEIRLWATQRCRIANEQIIETKTEDDYSIKLGI